ncbi:MAG: cation:proton antiporter [Deltaproteobacteria bacterium]|nr:cation:proton antiporter [Deltaproteobacteria bacterium]
MEATLMFGVILFVGFFVGELLFRVGFPRVTGYILAGIALNPRLNGYVPASVVNQSNVITNFSLAFITFSVGGTLLISKIRALGKSILTITVFEGEFAFLFVTLVFALVTPLVMDVPGGWLAGALPMALLIGALGSPTDPSATLAVVHEYHAKGPVTDTIMGVAAFDDGLGILNYSLGLVVAMVLVTHQSFSFSASIGEPLLKIAGALGLGAAFAASLALLIRTVLRRETEGALIVVVLGLLGTCFGVAKLAGLDELLTTMVMGAVYVNIAAKGDAVFSMLERYTEELVFVLFFTISGMHLDPEVLASSWILVIMFVAARAAGKISGSMTGAVLSHASPKVRRYVVGGLIPQGGIVIGLALVTVQNPHFAPFSNILLNVILGATVVHELAGPLFAKLVLKAAGEIKKA